VLPSQITLNGKIRAAHITPVTTQVPGTIDAFEANVGDEVYQGQVLARIGSSGLESTRADAAAALEKAQNRVEESEKAVTSAQLEASRAHADAERSRLALDRATKVYERQKTLFQAGATPRLVYEKAVDDYESATEEWDAVDKAQRAAASRVQDTLKQLDNAKRLLVARNEELEDAQSAVAAGAVESPVHGLVVARQGELGQQAVEVGGELFEVATDLYDLEVMVEPSPEIRKRMRPHEPALVIIPDWQNTGYPGEIKQFVDKQVVIGFSTPTPAIRPGMVAEVRLHPE
jgi:multidrug resistance efflux pump